MAHEIEMVLWIKRKIIIEVQVGKPLRVIKKVLFTFFSMKKKSLGSLLKISRHTFKKVDYNVFS